MTHARRYWDVLRRWFWLVLLGVAVAAGVSYLVSRSLTPVYRATATVLVNQAQGTSGAATYNDILTSERLTRTYGELLRKRPIIEEVITNLSLPITYEQLVQTMDVRPVRDTQLITLTVEHREPQLAADIANATVNIFVAWLVEEQLGQTTSTKEIMQQQVADLERQIKVTGEAVEQARQSGGDQASARLTLLQSELGQYQATYAQLLRSHQEMALAEARATNVVRLAEPAVAPDRPVRPQVLLNTLIAGVVGLLLAVGLALLVEYLDDAVKTPERVESASGLHTLGEVALATPPSQRGKQGQRAGERLLIEGDSHSPVGEAFRILRTNIGFAQLDKDLRTLLVTSANPGEGKSTIAANLAVVYAQTGRNVLLVEADLRRPSLHRTFELHNDVGLTTLLARDDASLDQAVVESAVPGLSLLSGGPTPPNPSEMLGSARFARLLKEAEQAFDLVILDTPPGLAVADPIILAPRVDGVVVVVDSAKTSRDALKRLADALRHANANVLGVVLNKLTPRSGGYYYYRPYDDQPGDNGRVRRRVQEGEWSTAETPGGR